jgi:hypothetical protein
MYKFPTVPEVPSVDGLLSAGAAEEERLKAAKAKTVAPPKPSTHESVPVAVRPKVSG